MSLKALALKSAVVRQSYLGWRLLNGRMGAFMRRGFPIDEERPYPWLTTPAIDFLDSIDLSGKHILELGSGFSTAFFDRKKAICHSFERDGVWLERVRAQITGRSQVFAFTTEDEVRPPLATYDVLVVDVFPRPHFFEAFFPRLHGDGFCVFDNSDWYPEFFGGLRKHPGIFIVDFHGYAPGGYRQSTTSIIYRRRAVHAFEAGRHVTRDHEGRISEHDRPPGDIDLSPALSDRANRRISSADAA